MSEQSGEKVSEKGLPEVVTVKQSRFSPIWIIPLIAAGIGIWLVCQAIMESGIPITITFKDGSNIVPKAQIKYEGVIVGEVVSVKLNSDLDGVVVEAKLNRSAKKLARAGSMFWVVRPQIGLSGVSGLETIISGSYIEVKLGQGQPAKVFKGVENPPFGDPGGNPLRIIVKSDKLGSLHAGVPVFYREVQVGEVVSYKLAENAKTVDIDVDIMEKYALLVRENTRFWNASGIGMSVNLFGAKIKTESLASILTGGMAFATPNNDQMGAPSKAGAIFSLVDTPQDEWLQWQPDIDLTGKENQSSSSQQRPVQKEKDRNYTF